MFDGTANQASDNSEICDECQGYGYVDVSDDDEEIDCPNCLGDGRIYYSEVKYDY